MKSTVGTLLGIILLMLAFTTANAAEVRQVETHGSVGFTGVYEPIGKPDPPPVTDIAKPGGRLPQTNDSGSSWITWSGIGVLAVVFILRRRKTQDKNQEESRKIQNETY